MRKDVRRHRQTDRQTNRQTERQTDRHSGRHADVRKLIVTFLNFADEPRRTNVDGRIILMCAGHLGYGSV